MLTCCQDVHHPQGTGRLVIQDCEVKFDLIIPQDTTRYPYWLFNSKGIHTHPPPPPVRTPEAIVEEIRGAIQKINDPSLSVGNTKPLSTRYEYNANMFKQRS